MNESGFTRRAFVGSALASPLGMSANDRVRLGIIGTGGRGRYHIGELRKLPGLNVAVTAVCDVYRPNRESGAAELAKIYGSSPRQTSDYRELLCMAGEAFDSGRRVRFDRDRQEIVHS